MAQPDSRPWTHYQYKSLRHDLLLACGSARGSRDRRLDRSRNRHGLNGDGKVNLNAQRARRHLLLVLALRRHGLGGCVRRGLHHRSLRKRNAMLTPDPERPSVIHLPAPTPWPFVLAFAITLLLAGFVTNFSVSILGGILAATACVGWFRDVFSHGKDEMIEGQTDLTSTA